MLKTIFRSLLIIFLYNSIWGFHSQQSASQSSFFSLYLNTVSNCDQFCDPFVNLRIWRRVQSQDMSSADQDHPVVNHFVVNRQISVFLNCLREKPESCNCRNRINSALGSRLYFNTHLYHSQLS